MRKSLCYAVLLAGLLLVSARSGAAEPLHVLIMLGEHEYKTEVTLPAFAKADLEPLGVKVTTIAATKLRTTYTKDKADFPGLAEAIPKADVIVLSVRRRQVTTEVMAAFKAHLDGGKGLVSLRTSVTPFQPGKLSGRSGTGEGQSSPPAPKGYAHWDHFGLEVLAASYTGHEGGGDYDVSPAPSAKGHPILKGVAVKKGSKLYRIHPLRGEAAKPILLGRNTRLERDDPVVWTNLYGPKKARIVGVSGGTAFDMKQPTYNQLLVNAIHWAAGRTAPRLKVKAEKSEK